MKRLQRLSAVRGIMEEQERRQAARLAQDERRFVAAQQRLQELEHYRADYARQLDARASTGIGAMALRDYQTFLARLDDAIRQQAQIVSRSATELEFERSRWRDAAIRLKSVSTVIEKWQHEDRAIADRAAQIETDERALQKAVHNVLRNSDESF
jgi:flagellar FliJ protein